MAIMTLMRVLLDQAILRDGGSLPGAKGSVSASFVPRAGDDDGGRIDLDAGEKMTRGQPWTV